MSTITILPRQETNKYIWKPEWIMPYESSWGIVNRFCYFNWIRPADIVRGNITTRAELEPIRIERKTRKLINEKLCACNCPKSLSEPLSLLLKIPEGHFKPFAPVFITGLNECYQNQFVGDLRYCPECMRYGIHLVPHQLIYFDTCFVHGCRLVEHETIRYNIAPSFRSFPKEYWEKEFREDFNILPMREIFLGLPKLRESILMHSASLDFISTSKRIEVMCLGDRCVDRIDLEKAEELISFRFDEAEKDIKSLMNEFRRSIPGMSHYDNELIDSIEQNIIGNMPLSQTAYASATRFIYKMAYHRIVGSMPSHLVEEYAEVLDDVLTGRRGQEILDALPREDLLKIALFRSLSSMRYFHEICAGDSFNQNNMLNRIKKQRVNSLGLGLLCSAMDYPLSGQEVPQDIRNSIKLLAENFICDFISDCLMKELLKDLGSISFEDMIFRLDEIYCGSSYLPTIMVRITDEHVSLYGSSS